MAVLVPALLGSIAASSAGCFNFAATMAGGPLADGGSDDARVTSPTLDGSTDAASDGHASSDAGPFDGSPIDASGVDATITDSGGHDATSLDAAHDASTDADTPIFDSGVPAELPDGETYCDWLDSNSGATFIFCDDFDNGPLGSTWTQLVETGGALALTGAAVVTPPNALDLTTNPEDAGNAVDVALRRANIGLPSNPLTLTFTWAAEAVKVDQAIGAAIVLGSVDFLAANTDRYSIVVGLAVEAGAANINISEQSGFADGGTTYVPHPISPAASLAVGTWSLFTLTMSWTGSALGNVTMAVDGQQVLSTPFTLTVVPESLQVDIGTSYVYEPSDGWELRYDDVVFTEK